MGLLIAFLALFLLVLGAFAFAAIKLFAVRDTAGKLTAPGCVIGCATACVLGLLAFLGLCAFTVGVAAIVGARAVDPLLERVPGVDIGVWRDPERIVHRDPSRPLHVVLEWDGHIEPTREVLALFDDLEEGGVIDAFVDYVTNDAGAPITVVDITLPLSHHDAADFDRLLEEVADKFDLDTEIADGIQVRLRKIDATHPTEAEHEPRGELR